MKKSSDYIIKKLWSVDINLSDIDKMFRLLKKSFDDVKIKVDGYENIEEVFIRHHTTAKEVDEEEFFYSRETGGTVVSSALELTRQTMSNRYPPSEWNLYIAQASDGDNWDDDSPQCASLLTNYILPEVQYFSYIEITPQNHQALWHAYEKLGTDWPHEFAMAQIKDAGDIYSVFRELFAKQTNNTTRQSPQGESA